MRFIFILKVIHLLSEICEAETGRNHECSNRLGHN